MLYASQRANGSADVCTTSKYTVKKDEGNPVNRKRQTVTCRRRNNGTVQRVVFRQNGSAPLVFGVECFGGVSGIVSVEPVQLSKHI